MTYEELAKRYTVRICTGCPGGYNHKEGGASLDTIHWFPRRVSKPGLRRFLKLAVLILLGLNRMPEPQRTYWMASGAEDLARQINVRFPRRYADLDRARVRSGLVGATYLDEDTRKIMERWSRT